MALSVLVVDDYEPIRRHLSSRLEQQPGVRVIGQAADGLEAIQKAEALQPDLIVLDISLPKLNGLQAAGRVRELAPLARILFVSADFSFHLVEAALRSGAAGYVHKLRVHADLPRAVEAIRRGQYFVSGVVKGGFGKTAIGMPPIRHEVQFCSDDAILRESFADFIAATLRSDKAAILIAAESTRAGVLQGLEARDLDVGDAIQRGTLVSMDVTEAGLPTVVLNETLEPARLFDAAGGLIEAAARAARAVRAGRGARVAVCRECSPLLVAEGRLAEAVRLEQLWNLIAYTSVFDLLCVYAMARFEKHKTAFQSICAEHSTVFVLANPLP